MSTDPAATGPHPAPERDAAAPPLVDQLTAAVLAVSGVAALEPGIATTLHALDARIRRAPGGARTGLHLDLPARRLVIEVAVRSLHPLRSVVEQLQATVLAALRRAGHEDVTVIVRVQSVA